MEFRLTAASPAEPEIETLGSAEDKLRESVRVLTEIIVECRYIDVLWMK